jgi:hypothetical protein
MPDALDRMASGQTSAAPPAVPPPEIPQAPTEAPLGQAAPQGGGDALDRMANQYKEPNSIAESMKGWWDWTKQHLDNANEWANQQFVRETEAGKQIINHEIAQAHPYRAAMAQFYFGSLDDAAKIGTQLTQPKNLALMFAGAARLKTLKLLASAANVYFAWRGGQELFGEREANESQADFVQRKLLGAAGLTGGVGGALGGLQDVATLHRQQVLKKLGLTGDLAGQVDAKVSQAESIRQKATLENAQAAGDVMDVAQQMKLQAPTRMGQIVKDASHAVYSENARVSKLFDDLAEKLAGPVSDAPTVRAKILDTLKDHGIQDQEIPPKIFNALPKAGKTADAFVDLGGGPTSLEAVKDIAARRALGETAPKGFEDVRTPVSFKDLTRVRTDLWDAAAAAKDGVVAKGLYDAYDGVTQMQQDYAQSKGVDDEYRFAKNEYRDFKRELGSGLMSDFLRASNFEDQAMSPRISKIMTGQDAEALRGLLKIAGVDVSPLDELTGGKKVGTAVKELQAGAAKKAAGVTKAAEVEARAIGKNKPIIPGRSDFALVGKSTEQIRSEAIEKLAGNMKAAGISKPMAMFMLLYGSIRLGMGSPFGAYPAGRGAATLLRGNLLRNPSYQDWLIRESGVDPTNQGLIDKVRRGLDRMSRFAIAPAAVGAGEKNAPDQTGISP